MGHHTLGKTLVVPAVLAVSVVAACGDSKPSTTSDATSTAASSSTAEPTTPTSGTTMATTPTSTGATDTGGLPDCSMFGGEAACEAEMLCFWYAEIGQCVVDCPQIKDEATCNTQGYCEWFNNQCELLLV